MGLGKPQLHAEFEVAGFVCDGNIRQSFSKDKFGWMDGIAVANTALCIASNAAAL